MQNLLNSVHSLLKGNTYKTNCRLYMKDGNKLGCLVKNSCKSGQCLEDMAVEGFNNGSHDWLWVMTS